jgi:microcin C transport system substrate-binding protein
MFRIDEIVHEEAFYIPFWTAPYIRIAHWDYVRFPEYWLPKRTQQLTDYLVYWIDPKARADLEVAMKEGRALPLDPVLDKDFYNLRAKPAAPAKP